MTHDSYAAGRANLAHTRNHMKAVGAANRFRIWQAFNILNLRTAAEIAARLDLHPTAITAHAREMQLELDDPRAKEVRRLRLQLPPDTLDFMEQNQ